MTDKNSCEKCKEIKSIWEYPEMLYKVENHIKELHKEIAELKKQSISLMQGNTKLVYQNQALKKKEQNKFEVTKNVVNMYKQEWFDKIREIIDNCKTTIKTERGFEEVVNVFMLEEKIKELFE